jgi:threonine synthase
VLHDENLRAERARLRHHLECAYTGERHNADEVHNLSRAGKACISL